MTLAQFKAIMTRLKENNSIIIKKADKGSNVVIQNRSDYIEEGLSQLQETSFYKRTIYRLTSFRTRCGILGVVAYYTKMNQFTKCGMS